MTHYNRSVFNFVSNKIAKNISIIVTSIIAAFGPANYKMFYEYVLELSSIKNKIL